MSSVRRLLIAAVLTLTVLPGFRAFAWEPTFGGELTFTREDLDRTNPSFSFKLRKTRATMLKLITARCQAQGDCTVRRKAGKWLLFGDYEIQYKDGWSWRLSMDYDVVEIQTAPSTLARLAGLQERIERDIFGLAASIGLKPARGKGGGHIHIGVQSAFEGNATLFRNFLVDSVNHADLYKGILGEEWEKHARQISDLDTRDEFVKVIQEFDEGKITTISELAKQIEKRVYKRARMPGNTYSSKAKPQALNLSRILAFLFHPERQTLELRALAAQASASIWLKQIRMFEERIAYLKRLDGRVPIWFTDPEMLSRMTGRGDAAGGFYRFIQESGLQWKDYREMMPEGFALDPFAAQRIPNLELLEHTAATRAANQSVSEPKAGCLARVMHTIVTLGQGLRFGY